MTLLKDSVSKDRVSQILTISRKLWLIKGIKQSKCSVAKLLKVYEDFCRSDCVPTATNYYI